MNTYITNELQDAIDNAFNEVDDIRELDEYNYENDMTDEEWANEE